MSLHGRFPLKHCALDHLNNWSPSDWTVPLLATDGLTLGMVFSESVEADKWARKDGLCMQSVLGWVSRQAKQWHLLYSCMFEAIAILGPPLLLYLKSQM